MLDGVEKVLGQAKVAAGDVHDEIVSDHLIVIPDGHFRRPALAGRLTIGRGDRRGGAILLAETEALLIADARWADALGATRPASSRR